MMVTMKKIISLLLSFVMIFTLLTPAFAASSDTSLPTIQQNQTTISLSNNSRIEFVSPLTDDINTYSNNSTNELNNGRSFLIKEFINDELTHTVQGTFGGNELICIDYENGLITNQKIINIADRITANNDNSACDVSSYSYGSVLGRIVYNKDIGNTVPGEILTVYSKITKQDSEAYTINGAVTDTISDIVGILTSIFFAVLPVEGLLMKVAVGIVGYYGGKVTGGLIGVAFTEDVSAYATYYTLTGYHAASNYHCPTEICGVKRFVTTQNSSAYKNTLYEGYTPYNWTHGDAVASILWTAVFARPFPYVYKYN